VTASTCPHTPTLLLCCPPAISFNDTATTEIYTLSLHDALPIYPTRNGATFSDKRRKATSAVTLCEKANQDDPAHHQQWHTFNCRSEEHTSELQSRENLVCRLLLEKKKKKKIHE